MIEGKRVLALIPARGGSKGIKDKNITPLCGKPLIAYSVLAAKNSRYIDDVVVTTDSERIAETAKAYGAEVPFLRPAELASDTAKTIDAVLHAVDFVCAQTAGGLVDAREAGIDDGGGAAALADDHILGHENLLVSFADKLDFLCAAAPLRALSLPRPAHPAQCTGGGRANNRQPQLAQKF